MERLGEEHQGDMGRIRSTLIGGNQFKQERANRTVARILSPSYSFAPHRIFIFIDSSYKIILLHRVLFPMTLMTRRDYDNESLLMIIMKYDLVILLDCSRQ